MIENKINQQSKTKGLGPTHYMQKEKLNNKLIKIQDLFIEDDLSKQEYENAKRRYKKNLEELSEKEANFKKNRKF